MEHFKKDLTISFLQCEIAEKRTLVFGEGPINSPALMLIGEAPGEQETLQGRPFVGKAGKNLDAFLEAVHLKREEIYISNVVKVRPSKISAAGRVVNRPPSKEEKAWFTPWLMREIVFVKPKAIVTLGNVALQAFVNDVIGNRHGRWSRVEIPDEDGKPVAMPLFALYHPASVIYNRALKETYDADLLQLSKTLNVCTDSQMDI